MEFEPYNNLDEWLYAQDQDTQAQFLNFWGRHHTGDSWGVALRSFLRMAYEGASGAVTNAMREDGYGRTRLERKGRGVQQLTNIVNKAWDMYDRYQGQGKYEKRQPTRAYVGPRQNVILQMGPQFDPSRTMDIGERLYIDSIRDKGDDYLPDDKSARLFTTKTEIRKNKRIKELKRFVQIINSVHVSVDTIGTGYDSTYGRIHQIGDMAQGTGKNQRIGNRVFLKYIQINAILKWRHIISGSSTYYTGKKIGRLALIFDKYPGQDSTFSTAEEENLIEELLPDETSTVLMNMHQQKTQEYGPNDRFIIIMDKMIENAKDNEYVLFKWEKEFKGLTLNYANSSTAYPIKGQPLLYISTDNEDNCTCGSNHRLQLSYVIKVTLHYT